jgi:heme exporter protein B
LVKMSTLTQATPALPPRAPSYGSTVWTVLMKDLTIELRTREIVTTAGFFGVLVALMASVAYATGTATTVRVAPGTLWLSVAFASILALGRTWQREREDSCFIGLLTTPLPRGALFLGKAAGVFLFVTAIELVVLPVVALVLHVELLEVGGQVVILLVLGTIGVASTGTLFGAMTVRTRARDLALATVLFPLLSPTLISGVAATREILQGAPFSDVTDYVILLIVFDVIALLGGITMFGALVDD